QSPAHRSRDSVTSKQSTICLRFSSAKCLQKRYSHAYLHLFRKEASVYNTRIAGLRNGAPQRSHALGSRCGLKGILGRVRPAFLPQKKPPKTRLAQTLA